MSMCVMMMIIIVPNSLVRQKERAQGEEEEEVEDRRKGGQTGTLPLAAEAPTGPSRSGVLDARSRRKHGRWFYSTGRAEGARD